MRHEQIARWVQRLEASRIRGFEFEEDGTVLRLQFGRPAPASATPDEQAAGMTRSTSTTCASVRAPAAGVFHAGHPLSGDASFDAQVRKDDIVGFLRVGEMMTAVVAPCDGWLGPPEVADGTLVGWGHSLFTIG